MAKPRVVLYDAYQWECPTCHKPNFQMCKLAETPKVVRYRKDAALARIYVEPDEVVCRHCLKTYEVESLIGTSDAEAD